MDYMVLCHRCLHCTFYFFKKTQHLKCYLSKPIAYKEDPHWFSVIEFLMEAGGHQGAEFVVERRCEYPGYAVLLGLWLLGVVD